MAYTFLRGDRDQPFLLPPDLRDWLPQGHLAWFILDVVDQLDLDPFYRQHRDDEHGHPAYDPKTLLGVLLYGYCLGVRSCRQIERRCTEDLAFRVLAANQTPDHVTIARFRVRHETALAGFLVESLKLCATAAMVRVGTVALDGTKLAGNAADKANRTHERLKAEVAEILRQAAEIDQHEDRLFGNARGDELPPALANKAGRLARLRHAKARLEAETAARQQRYEQRVAAAAAAKAEGRPSRQLKPRPRDEAARTWGQLPLGMTMPTCHTWPRSTSSSMWPPPMPPLAPSGSPASRGRRNHSTSIVAAVTTGCRPDRRRICEKGRRRRR
jgi:transposase